MFSVQFQSGRTSPHGGKNSPENIPPTISEVDADAKEDSHPYLGGGIGRGKMGSNRGAIASNRGGRDDTRTRRTSEGERDKANRGDLILLGWFSSTLVYMFMDKALSCFL